MTTPTPRLTVGQSASLSRTITEADVAAFAQFTGDRNPVHLDEDYARTTRFGRRIAHGMLSASLIGTLLGVQLPGPGSVYLSQDLKFRAPVFIGDTVTARVEVVRIRDDKPLVTLATTCHNQHGELVIEGQAVILLEQA